MRATTAYASTNEEHSPRRAIENNDTRHDLLHEVMRDDDAISFGCVARMTTPPDGALLRDEHAA